MAPVTGRERTEMEGHSTSLFLFLELHPNKTCFFSQGKNNFFSNSGSSLPIPDKIPIVGKSLPNMTNYVIKFFRTLQEKNCSPNSKVGVMGHFFRTFICLAIFCLCGWGWGENRSDAAQNIFHAYAKPSPPPDFAVEGLDGKTINFKDRTGEVILVNFWATW